MHVFRFGGETYSECSFRDSPNEPLPRVFCAGAHLKPWSKSMCVDVSGVPPSKLSIWQYTGIMLKLLGEVRSEQTNRRGLRLR